jgi:hypothetical protein
MRIIEIEKGDLEVLEEIAWDEAVQRSDNLRFFPVEQQLDDLVQSILPVGVDIPPSIMRKANEVRDLAKSLYYESTGYTTLGVPYAKTPIVEPLELSPIPNWIIPKVLGVEILRDQPIEPSNLYKVISSMPDGKKLPIWEANAYQEYEKQKIMVGNSGLNYNQVPTVAIYDGFRVTNKGSEKVPNYVAEPTMKTTSLLDSYKIGRGFEQANGDILLTPEAIYPSETYELNGWVILPSEPKDSENVLEKIKKETIVNPPTTQIWFQDKPVVLTEFRDIMNNRPTISEVIDHFPKPFKNPHDSDLKKYLKKYNLSIKDIAWDKFESLFPSEPEPEPFSGKVEKFEIENRPIPDSASLPSVYPPYQPGLSILNWLTNQPDGGAWVRVAHAINSIKNKRETSIEISPIGAQPVLEKTTIGTCMNADSYNAMLRTGVFDSATSTCVPVEILKRAEVQRRIKDRITHLALLKQLEDYKGEIELLLLMSKASEEMLQREYQKVDVKSKEFEVSQERATILNILRDEEKPDSEKVQNIMALLDDWKATVENYQYYNEGLFLICQHSIEELQTKDIEEFYEKYAVKDNGRKSCKYCGQVIGSVDWDMEEEYDENGFKSITREIMSGSVKAISENQKKTNLLKNKLQIDVRYEGQMIYKLMMILGIEPEEIQFDQFVRSAFSFTDMKMKGVPIIQQQLLREIFGLAWFVVLLKIHDPVLRPTRQFPRLIFNLDGYPRSSEDENYTSPMIDYLLGVLVYAYRQASSVNVRKGTDKLISSIIESPDRIRGGIINILRQIVPTLGSEVKFNNVEEGTNAETLSVVGIDNIEETSPRSLGQWLYGKVLKTPPMPILTGNQELVDLIKKDYDEIMKKVEVLRSEYLAGVVQSIPLIVKVEKSMDGSTLDQNVVLFESELVEIERINVSNTDLRNILKSTSEAVLETRIKEFITKNPTKDKSTISLKRSDTNMKVVYECKVLEGIVRNLVRMFVGKSMNGYSSRAILSSDNDKVRASIRNIEAVVGKIPILTYDGNYVKDIMESMNEFPSWAIPEIRLVFYEWCVRAVVDDLKAVFGGNTVKDAFELLSDIESELYRYSPAEIADRIVKIRSKEREAFRTRLGQKSDAERNTIVDMMGLGLLESSVVVNMDDRAAFAEEVEAENYSVLPISQSQDNDDGIPTELYEEGNYGELMDEPEEDYTDYNLSKYSDE